MTEKQPSSSLILTAAILALIAFAANSILCRLALGEKLIDPVSFTQLRILSGAVTMLVLVLCNGNSLASLFNNKLSLTSLVPWRAPLLLFSYAIFFSLAYVTLDTATGALILFATVQLCMLGIQLIFGKPLNRLEWIGVVLSITGFIWLLLPGTTMPSPLGFALMVIAGISWALYTLLGKKTDQPILTTARNFILAVPVCILLMMLQLNAQHFTLTGALLAVGSGSLASGLGYSVWYFAVRHLSLTSAAVGQLSVPLIAAAGGIWLVDEALSSRLILSGSLILSGIGMAIFTSLQQPQGPGQHKVQQSRNPDRD